MTLQETLEVHDLPTAIVRNHLRGLKLDPPLTSHRLAADLASATQGLTGADIAYLCQRAAMFCVKDAISAAELADIAVARKHFSARARHGCRAPR